MFVSATLVGRSLVLSLSKPSLWADTARGWFWWVRHGMQDYIAMVVKYAHPHNKRENVKNISPPFMGVCACFGVFIIYLFIFHSSLSWSGCKVYAEHSCQNTFKLHGGYCTVIQSIKGGWSWPLRKGEITQLKTISCWFSTSDLQKFKRV